MSNRSTIVALVLLVLLASCACLGALVSWTLNSATSRAEALAFTADHNEDDAASAFLRRYGQPPRFAFENLGLLLVGPVPGLEGGV